MQNTTIVETNGLTKRFGSRVLAVDAVNMSVRRGEVYGFLGPNGAGKTTTLRMLVGLIRPTSGTATVAGLLPVPQRSGEPPRRRRHGERAPQARGGGARHRRALEPRWTQVRHLLDRHEAASRRRGRAAQGPRAADPRRAHQRPRSARHGRDAQAHQGHRPGRPDCAFVEPPARRGRTDLRPRRRHQQRAPRQAVDRPGPARRGRRAGPRSAAGPSGADAHDDVRQRRRRAAGRRAAPQGQARAEHRDQSPARLRRHRCQRAAAIREIAGGSLLPAHRRKAGIMIATIKAEWRKSRFRPAFLVSSGIIAGITVLIYSVNWYLALHPGSTERVANILTLYLDQLVNFVMGAAFPVGAAMAIVVGALFTGSEFGWSTLKTTFTQGPGRLTVWAGRVVVFAA